MTCPDCAELRASIDADTRLINNLGVEISTLRTECSATFEVAAALAAVLRLCMPIIETAENHALHAEGLALFERLGVMMAGAR